MDKENFLEKLASQFGQNASVKNVYGEPILAGTKTIIPVAQIAYGLGGGYGQGKQKKEASKPGEALSPANEPFGEGAGGGGGMYARPKGVYEITHAATRFIPVNNVRQLFVAVALGFLIRGFFSSGKCKKCRKT